MLRKIFLLLLLPTLPAWSGTVQDFALGSYLAGGYVDVTRFGGLHNSAVFVPVGTGAMAEAVGSAGFTLTVSAGDTSLATWTLTNTDPSLIFLNKITAVSIDLTLSGRSLFDSGSTPSTPYSGPGIPGVIYIAGNGISGATEFVLWSDPSNLGDMYAATTITFSTSLGPGDSSSWSDDTDVVVPEPGTIVLMGAGILGLAGTLRRKLML